MIASSDAGLHDDLAAATVVRLDVSDLAEVYADMALVQQAHRTPSPMARRAIDGVWAAVRPV